MPKILRGNQVEAFKQKFVKLDLDKKKLIIPNVKTGKDGTLTIKNYSKVVELRRITSDDLDEYYKALE